ncbi:YlaH-like family protein [Staphylospora marina]|uniref:YlaH-like family protein n=1 Tax=Staphylospora marina TaxID=2490858 RepID=UPI000F5BAB5B|nr:YlaH-like family protein [Staphylospora marina]
MWTAFEQWLDSIGFWGVYAVILVLSGIIYKTAFAIRLPVLKSAVIYFALAVGCVLLTVFHYTGLPIVAAMLVTIVLIAVTRIRLWAVRKKKSGPQREEER